MRIHQIWIIMNNGVCPIHILYKGQTLDENLFAGFVRALFSFSKDMSLGEKSISAMSFGDMEIHYLAHPEEKYFVAIAADANADMDTCSKYLKYISDLFITNYPIYIEKLPPFEPKSFVHFKNSIDEFVRFYESKYDNSNKGIKDIIFKKPIKSIQTSINQFILEFGDDNILKLLNKNNLGLEMTFYPETGNVKQFSLQNESKYLAILSDTNFLSIKPIFFDESSSIPIIHNKLEGETDWVFFHPTKNFVYYGNKRELFQFDIEKGIIIKSFVDQEINKVLIHKTDVIFIINNENRLFQGSLPLKSDKLDLNDASILDEVYSLNYGPNIQLVVKCIDQSIYFWDGISDPISLIDKFPTTSKFSYSELNSLIFLITEYNEFVIYEMDGNQLVNYNLIGKGIHASVDENLKLSVVYSNGIIKPFPATIDRDQIIQLRQFLSKRVDTVENHITRIYNGFQKVLNNLDQKRSSTAIKNDLNQIKVFRQQLKRLIDPKLIERTSILRDIFFRLNGLQNQVKQIMKLIIELEENLEIKMKNEKENELSGKSSKERIDEYLGNLKPRQTIGIGILSDRLQLPYEEVLNYIRIMEQNGLLPGFLTRGSGSSLKDSVIFVKKDPRFKESGITSF